MTPPCTTILGASHFSSESRCHRTDLRTSQCRVIDVIEECAKCGALHPDDEEWVCEPYSDVSMDESDDEIPLRGVSATFGRKKRAKSHASSAASFNKTSKNGAVDLTFVPPRKKKGARTEAQRRAILNADRWTTTVAPHHVGCRGCKKTIKLDARSRYYPGLWEKHRERCEGVNTGRALVRMALTSGCT
jgi:hypothetical protein